MFIEADFGSVKFLPLPSFFLLCLPQKIPENSRRLKAVITRGNIKIYTSGLKGRLRGNRLIDEFPLLEFS